MPKRPQVRRGSRGKHSALDHVLSQIAASTMELRAYEPVAINWRQRAEETAETLVPWLCDTAPDLRDFVERCLNSTTRIRELLASIGSIAGKEAVVVELKQLFEAQAVLVERLAGDVISRVVTLFLVRTFARGALVANGGSDYPDMYLATHDYTALPRHARNRNDYGASVKGNERRPARVPDGLELKTIKSGGRVDCHFNHMGLHLALVHRNVAGGMRVEDIKVAFLRPSDYRESGRNTAATTVKYSFTLQPFESVFE